MSIIDELITDRAENDLQELKRLLSLAVDQWTEEELAWFISGKVKGSYKAADMNRVGIAIRYLVDRLSEIGISVNAPAKVDWTLEDIPTANQALFYTVYVRTIRNALTMPDDVPGITNGLTNLTYEKANDIERILAAVYNMIQNVQSNIDLGWALGTSYTGLYAAAPSLRLMTEGGALLVDDRDRQPDLLHLPEGGAGQIIVEYNGGNYLCEVT